MGFLPLAIVVWMVAMAAWYFISKYFKSSDADKIKQRLTGIGKARKKTKENKDGEQSIIHTQQGGNKLAQLLVEKYQLGPKIQLFLEQAGLRWSSGPPGAFVHHGVRRRIRVRLGDPSDPVGAGSSWWASRSRRSLPVRLAAAADPLAEVRSDIPGNVGVHLALHARRPRVFRIP